MHAALWVVTAALVSFGALVFAGMVRVGPRLSKLVLALLVVIATVLLLVVADRVVGKVRGKPAAGLIFPPSSEVGYETPEFRVVVKSNSLGFRGDEVPAAKGSAYRIVAIGDSFTMGWGLDHQDTWTALLQKRLRAGGDDVLVLNLGQGGADADLDMRNAAKAIPALKPDLVIVGLLQGDDLFQIVERMKRGDAPPVDLSRWERSLGGSILAFLRGRMFPNLLSSTLKTTVTANWKETAARIQENLTPEQRQRFDRMDGAARSAFLAGGLNPIVVQSAILFPDYYVRHLDPTVPETRRGIERTAECLREIAGVAARHGAQVVVTVVPYRAYVSVRDCDALRRLGIRDSRVARALERRDAGDPRGRRARRRLLHRLHDPVPRGLPHAQPLLRDGRALQSGGRGALRRAPRGSRSGIPLARRVAQRTVRPLFSRGRQRATCLIHPENTVCEEMSGGIA